MDILICQTCGIIIRGKTKFCTGCGATISRFSPTSLPVVAHTAAPLSVGFSPDPVALERAVNKYALARTNGNGNGNGNGHNYGYEQKYFAESESQTSASAPAASTATQDPEPAPMEGPSPNISSQGLMSTSRLQSILGSAVGGARTTGPLSKPSMSGLISLGADEKAEDGRSSSARIDRFTFDDEPDPNPAVAQSNEPPRPAQPIFSPTTNFAQSAAAAVNSWMSAPSSEPSGHAVYSSPPAAEPDPGSAQAFAPPPTPQAEYQPLQPQYQAPQPLPEPAPQPAPPVQSEPTQPEPGQIAPFQPTPAAMYNYQQPTPSPMAPFGSSSAFGASPEPQPSQQFINPPAQSSESSIAGAFAVNPYMPAAQGPIAGLATDEVVNCMSAAILNETIVVPDAPIIESSAGAPSLTLTSSSETEEVETSIFAASPYNQAQPPAATQSFAPAAEVPAAAASAPAEGGSVFQSFQSAPQAIPPAPAPVPAAETPAKTTSANLTPAQQSSFDFFAQPPAFTTPSSNSYSSGYSDSSSSSYSSSNSQTTASSSSSQDVFSSGMAVGAPSIVAQAIRAAQAASAFEIPEVKQEAPPPVELSVSGEAPASVVSDKTTLITDDSSAENSSEDKPSTRSKASMEDRPSRRGRSDDRQTKKEEPKVINVAGISMKQTTAMTLVVLSIFVGFPLFMLINWIGGSLGKGTSAAGGTPGQAQSGAGGGLGGMFNNSASSTNLSGRWELGFLGTNGQANQGTLNITQRGSDIDGWGVDKAPFLIKGILAYPKLQFNKQYITNGQKQGKPILYSGTVDWVNPQPQPPFMHVAGVWTFSKRDGFGWRGQIVTRSNKFEMQQVEKIDAATVAANNPANGEKIAFSTHGPGPAAPNGSNMPQASDHAGWASFFMRIAGGLLLFGMVLIFISVKMFGPSGTINILSKKEYIPSQFKSQHFKMVAELGKMLKPGGLPLGIRDDWSVFSFWRARRLALPPEMRDNNPHLILLGAGQKGKSRLMATMIAHDIESNDRAVVVVDSDGGLIDLLLTWIGNHPKGTEIAKRVLLIDPTHGGESMGYNPLEFPEDGDLQNAASAVVFGFKAIYTEPPGSQSQWTQQTANILRNSAVLLMANNKTLTDLPVLLSENDFRDVLLEKVERLRNEKAEYTTLLEAWAQYKRLARTDQWINWVEPILNRVHPMLGDPRIRPILTKPKGELNLKEIVKEGKILLVKIPQSQLDQNANLLGSLIVTGLKQAAMSLSMKGGSRKHPCALYLDEFDTFIEKETYDAITSETKKFQIGFIGASKTLQGLPEDYRNQLIINVGTMCCFALAKKDGDMLGPQMFRVDGRKIKHQTLQNIFNKVNTSPQFELISDEEKLNIDRVVGQEERTYFCYRVGTVAGVFQMKAPDFKDIPDKDVNWTLIEQIRSGSVKQKEA